MDPCAFVVIFSFFSFLFVGDTVAYDNFGFLDIRDRHNYFGGPKLAQLTVKKLRSCLDLFCMTNTEQTMES